MEGKRDANDVTVYCMCLRSTTSASKGEAKCKSHTRHEMHSSTVRDYDANTTKKLIGVHPTVDRREIGGFLQNEEGVSTISKDKSTERAVQQNLGKDGSGKRGLRTTKDGTLGDPSQESARAADFQLCVYKNASSGTYHGKDQIYGFSRQFYY